MSNPYDGQDPIDIAKRAEQNLNSDANIKGNKAGSSSSAFSFPLFPSALHTTPNQIELTFCAQLRNPASIVK